MFVEVLDNFISVGKLLLEEDFLVLHYIVKVFHFIDLGFQLETFFVELFLLEELERVFGKLVLGSDCVLEHLLLGLVDFETQSLGHGSVLLKGSLVSVTNRLNTKIYYLL